MHGQKSNCEQQAESQSLRFLHNFKEIKDAGQLLQCILKSYNPEEENIAIKMERIRNTLIHELNQFQETQKQHVKKHFICDQLKTYLEYFCGDSIQHRQVDQQTQLIRMKKTYIGYLEGTIDDLITKVKKWRAQNLVNLKRKEKQAKVNRLIYHSYNLKNYIEQLQLVKDLKKRVERILSEEIPDIRHFEDLSRKKSVPYTFYPTYCMLNCCKVIEKRVKIEQLVILTHSSTNLELLDYMKGYFFKSKTISEKCGIFVNFGKFIRILNKNSTCVENGFFLSFKPYFMETMREEDEISSTQYLKARSIMQSNQECIDIWKEYEAIKHEEYLLWYNMTLNSFKKSPTVHLQVVREVFPTYRERYGWVDQHPISQKIKPYIPTYIIQIICKVLYPLLIHLFFAKVPEQNMRNFEKFRIFFKEYWIYWLFHNYQKLYKFIRQRLEQMVSKFDKKEKNIFLQDSELSLQQYFSYYKQISIILQQQVNEKGLSRQFQDIWLQIAIRTSKSLRSNKLKLEITDSMKSSFESISMFEEQQKKLEQFLSSIKSCSSDSIQEQLYTFLTKLQFNTSNFFLIQKVVKLLGKDVEKQIQMIRQVAYNQFYT